MPLGDETIRTCRDAGPCSGVAWCSRPFFSSAVFFLPEGLFSACIAEGVWIGAETSSPRFLSRLPTVTPVNEAPPPTFVLTL